MTQDGIDYRARLKAPETKFTLDEEQVIVGYVIYRDLTMMSSTTDKLRFFVYHYFGREISSSFITKFMRRWNLSLKLPGNAKPEESMNREKSVEESSEWLESLERFMLFYNIPIDRLLAIDKTYLYTSPYHKHVRHIAPSGSIKPRKLTCSRGASMFSFIFWVYFLLCFSRSFFFLGEV